MSTFQEQIEAIKSRYAPQIEALKRRGEALRDKCGSPDDIEAMIGVDFELKMERTDISFDVPSVTMRQQHIALDVPEVFSESQTIIFHTPSVRMVRKKVGEYPEFHGFDVEWKGIFVDVPEIFMEEQRIIFDTPSVTMKRQDWYIDVPEFTMVRVDWSFDVPKITVRNVKGQIRMAEEEGRALKAEGERIAVAMKAEIAAVIGGAQASSAQDSHKVSFEAASQYDAAISKLQTAIGELVARGIDPIKIPTEGGEVNLRKRLAELVAQRDAALAAIPAQAAI
ncbi:MAG: hypothetical protein DI527_20065 [Chelatococcus sp.]|nr:MAG: hypothetical protein DI527_20065 [Chelatococcus sp.]